jgi:hypothetical protein
MIKAIYNIIKYLLELLKPDIDWAYYGGRAS